MLLNNLKLIIITNSNNTYVLTILVRDNIKENKPTVFSVKNSHLFILHQIKSFI